MKKVIILIQLLINITLSYSFLKIEKNFICIDTTLNIKDTLKIKRDTICNFTLPYSFDNSPFNRIIGRNDIILSDYYSFSDLLQNISGFYILNLGNPGQINSIIYEGTFSKNINIMIDGLPFNNTFFGVPDQSIIMTEDIDKIEILSNSQSILYGNQKTINLVTNKNNSFKPYTYVRHIEAPFDTYLTDGVFMQNISHRSNIMAGFNYQTSKGRYNNSDYTFFGGRFRYRYVFNKNIEINFSDYFTKNDRGINGGVKIADGYLTNDPFNGNVATVIFPNNREKYISNLTNIQISAFFFNDTTNHTLINLSYRNESDAFKSDSNNYVYLEQINQKINTNSFLISIKQNIILPYNNLIFFISSTKHLTNDLNFVDNASFKKINSFETFLSIYNSFNISKTFFINFGLSSLLSNNNELNSKINYSINPTLNFGSILFSFDLTKSYKNYSLYEQYIMKIKEYMNTPEKGITYTFNTKYSRLDEEFNIKIFYKKISSVLLAGNFITDHPISALIDRTIDTKIYGASFDCNLKLGNILFESKIDYNHYTEKLLQKFIPELYLYSGIYYYNNIFTKDIKLKIGLNGRYFSEITNLYYNIIGDKEVKFRPGGILNLFASLNIQTATIYLGIDNLLNHNYYTVHFYPQYDRSFKLAVSWAFWD